LTYLQDNKDLDGNVLRYLYEFHQAPK